VAPQLRSLAAAAVRSLLAFGIARTSRELRLDRMRALWHWKCCVFDSTTTARAALD
jgi:hypothetical protein